MARFFVRSMRGLGEYKGDIMVFTDADIKIESAEVINIGKRADFKANYLARTECRKHIDPSKYDWIFITDSDVAALYDVNPIFEAPRDAIYYREAMLSWKHQGQCMTKEEWEKCVNANCDGINCGMLVIPSEWYMDLMEKWEVEVTRCQKCMTLYNVDQNALNAIRMRGEFKWKTFAPLDVKIVRAVNMRHMQREPWKWRFRMMHYLAYSKSYMCTCMEQFYELNLAAKLEGKRKEL